MKDFNDFVDSFPEEKLNQICNSRMEKIKQAENKLEFKDEFERYNFLQKNQIVGLIFDFLEEYHKWLND